MLAVDTETTGLDSFHGCKPYLITCCDGVYNYAYWGSIDHKTREVTWDSKIIQEVQELLDKHTLIFHNALFDIRMLESIGLSVDFNRIEDILIASHLICSGDVHGLKDLAVKYLQYWDDDERDLQQAVTSTRERYRDDPNVSIAKEGHPHYPAVRSAKWWKQDLFLCPDLCQKYGVKDAERTYLLHKVFQVGIQNDLTMEQYRFRLALLPVFHEMQKYGIHVYMHKIEKYLAHLEYQLDQLTNSIQNISNFPTKFDPDKRSDLHHLLFSILKLSPTKYTDTGLPSTDKEALRDLLDSPSTHPKATEILTALRTWNHVTTKRDFVRSYKDWSKDSRLHSSINITGTHWTRQSSSDPNQQNFDNTLDFLFGPPKGYYWLYLDLVNIELRVWAYEVGSKDLIEAFERGESVHMIIARAIRPHQIAKYPSEEAWKAADSKHKQYTKTKAGTFTRLYGGSPATADKHYGIENASQIIASKIPEIGAYFKYLNKQAKILGEIYGYPRLYTIQGYPLDIPVQKPYTTPSARIQGSASIIVQDMMRLIVQSPIYNYGPQVHNLPLSPYTKRFSYHPSSSHAPDFHYMEHTNKCQAPNPYCHLIQQVHDSLKFEIPIHNNYETTNNLLLQELEAAGQLHIPTCPLDHKMIHYNDDPIKYTMYSYLPEIIDNHTITYHYNNGWECQVEGPNSIEYFIGESYEDVRKQAISYIKVSF